MMIACTSLPSGVTRVCRGMPNVWRGRPRRIRCWLVCLPAVPPGRNTWAERAPWTPATVTAWRLGRLRTAAYWHVHVLVGGWAPALLATLPPPTPGRLPLWGDGRHADTRGTKHPGAQQGRSSKQPPGFVGRRFGRLMAAGDGYRIPVGLRRMLPQHHAGYRREHAVLRERVRACIPPSWAKVVRVGGEAASGAKAPMRLVHARDQADPARRWGLGCASARPWKTVEENTRKPLVPQVPPQDAQRTQGPRETVGKGRRTCGTSHTRVWLRHGGDVTVGLRQTGRHVGSRTPQRLGPNLAAWTPRQGVSLSQKRWALALVHWERTSGRGLGQHQGSRRADHMEKSVGIAVLACLFVLRVC
jgi:hypothetical protein